QPSQDPPGVTEHAHQELAPASHGFDFRRNNRSRKAPGLLDTYDRSASFVSGPWRVPNVHDKTAANHAPAIVFCSEGKRHEQKRSSRNSLFGGPDLCCRGEKYGSCSHTFAA